MKRLALAATVALLLTSSSSAAILNSVLTVGENTLNDRNVARLNDRVGANGTVDVGDEVESILIFDNISNATFGGDMLGTALGDSTYQLTAHLLATVTSKTFFGAGPDSTVATADDVYFFTLALDAKVYEDNSSLANTFLTGFASQSAADTITRATDGNHILTLGTTGTGASTPGGLPGGPDFFHIISADDFSLLISGEEAVFVLGLGVIANPGGVPILADFTQSGTGGLPPGSGLYHDVVGVGEEEVASSAVLARGWETQSDTTVTFTVVPELPSFSVWAMLSGLIGLVAYRRNK